MLPGRPKHLSRTGWLLTLLAAGLAVFSLAYKSWGTLAGDPRPLLTGADDTGYYLWLRSGVIDGDFDFRNDLRETPTLDAAAQAEWLALPLTPAGRVPDKFPVGWAVATLPFFLLAHGVALAAGMPADGWSPIYFVGVWCGQLLIAAGGAFCALAVLRRFMSAATAWSVFLVLWIASPLAYYQTARVSMVHSQLFALTAAVTYLGTRIAERRDRWGQWLALGLLGGLLVITRATSVVYLFYPALVVGQRLFSKDADGRPWGRVAALLLPAVAMVTLQALAARIVNGNWLAEPYPGETFSFAHPQLLAVLFSSRHGLFYWHPLLLAGAVGLLWAVSARAVPWVWAVSFAVMIYLNAAWWCWWFGSSFGNRAFEGAVLYCMAGLGFGWEQLHVYPRVRFALRLAGAAGVTFGLFVFVLYNCRLVDRSDPVSYAQMWQVVWLWRP